MSLIDLLMIALQLLFMIAVGMAIKSNTDWPIWMHFSCVSRRPDTLLKCAESDDLRVLKKEHKGSQLRRMTFRIVRIPGGDDVDGIGS